MQMHTRCGKIDSLVLRPETDLQLGYDYDEIQQELHDETN